MKLRYGIIDENVLKRSVEDVILHERQRASSRTGKEYPGKSRKHFSAEKNPAGCAGTLAVIRNVNRLAEDHIQGRVFSPVLFLPPETEEEVLRELVSQICQTAFFLGLTVQKVHAEVTDAVNRPVVCGTMYGEVFCGKQDPADSFRTDESEISDNREGAENREFPDVGDPGTEIPKPGAADQEILTAGTSGMEILMAGTAGLEGTWILLKEHEGELRARFPESFLFRLEKIREDLCILEAAKAAAAAGVPVMVSPSGGGFFAGLWELSQKSGCGLEVDLQEVPILQETIEVTDHFHIHPYWMRSAGCLLMAAPDAARVSQIFLKKGIPVTVIGRLLPGKKEKILRNGEEIRYLERPRTDSLDLFERETRTAFQMQGR